MTDQTNQNPDNSSVPEDEISSYEILAKGTTLGENYEILDVSGTGGMATVYKGLQKSLNRTVAIKVLHKKFVRDSTFVERFDNEASILATLSHPNVVSIIDKGHDEENYYFVMEWLEGNTLDDRIIAHEATPDMWEKVISGCRDGVTYVHGKNVVHRDLKPSNIMIGEDKAIKIGDFGIIHIIAGDKSAANKISKKRRSLGTENYMAPEQETDDESVDERADVYSLAVTFFKMFTRRMPKEGGRTPSQHNSDVPVAVDAVINKALSISRDDRYQTVESFCNDLLKALKKQSTNISSVLGSTPSPRVSKSLYTGNDFTPPPKSPTTMQRGDKDSTGGKAVKKAPDDKKSSKAPLFIVGGIVLLLILAGGAYAFLSFMGIL